MLETLGIVLISLATSLVAGLLLQWKGDQFINRLKSRPTKRRIAVLSATYIRALTQYPYGFVHDFVLMLMGTAIVALGLGLIVLTYGAFAANTGYSLGAISDFANTVLGYLGIERLGWVIGFSSVVLWVAVIRPLLRIISIELLVPYAYRAIERLRQGVAKCGSPEEFLAYLDAEQSARNTEDLRNLFRQARTIIGDRRSKLTDQFFASISDSDPVAAIDALEKDRAKKIVSPATVPSKSAEIISDSAGTTP